MSASLYDQQLVVPPDDEKELHALLVPTLISFLSCNCDCCFPSNFGHLLSQVVERIKANPRETKLLVIEESGDQWYKERGLVIRGSQANVVFHATPEKKPCVKVEADSGAQETQSRDKDEEVVITGSTEAGTDCLNGESEPADSSPCLATQLKSGTDSTAESEQQEKRQESKSVTRESEASVEPEIIGKSITEEAVVAVVGKSGNNSIPESSLQATDAILVMSPEPQVADQMQEKREEAARVRKTSSLSFLCKILLSFSCFPIHLTTPPSSRVLSRASGTRMETPVSTVWWQFFSIGCSFFRVNENTLSLMVDGQVFFHSKCPPADFNDTTCVHRRVPRKGVHTRG